MAAEFGVRPETIRRLTMPEGGALGFFPGIHCVFIDGVADLCKSPNDDIEAFALVEHLAHLAIAYACPIIVVLHENPAGFETGKTRGHLGSQLKRLIKQWLSIGMIKQGTTGNCRRA